MINPVHPCRSGPPAERTARRTDVSPPRHVCSDEPRARTYRLRAVARGAAPSPCATGRGDCPSSYGGSRGNVQRAGKKGRGGRKEVDDGGKRRGRVWMQGRTEREGHTHRNHQSTHTHAPTSIPRVPLSPPCRTARHLADALPRLVPSRRTRISDAARPRCEGRGKSARRGRV